MAIIRFYSNTIQSRRSHYVGPASANIHQFLWMLILIPILLHFVICVLEIDVLIGSRLLSR